MPLLGWRQLLSYNLSVALNNVCKSSVLDFQVLKLLVSLDESDSELLIFCRLLRRFLLQVGNEQVLVQMMDG